MLRSIQTAVAWREPGTRFSLFGKKKKAPTSADVERSAPAFVNVFGLFLVSPIADMHVIRQGFF